MRPRPVAAQPAPPTAFQPRASALGGECPSPWLVSRLYNDPLPSLHGLHALTGCRCQAVRRAAEGDALPQHPEVSGSDAGKRVNRSPAPKGFVHFVCTSYPELYTLRQSPGCKDSCELSIRATQAHHLPSSRLVPVFRAVCVASCSGCHSGSGGGLRCNPLRRAARGWWLRTLLAGAPTASLAGALRRCSLQHFRTNCIALRPPTPHKQRCQ